jgi:polysaccharide export outer membrane protein
MVSATAEEYRVQPGDMLFISVWREETLQREVMVQPDGAIRFPLAGQVRAAGRTLSEIEAQLRNQLSRFIPDPALSVSLLQSLGNRIYVVGRVNAPGEYALTGKINVVQALALAGGITPFARKTKIKIVRNENGKQKTLRFNYKEVEKGESLSQNVFLKPGDTVIVP